MKSSTTRREFIRLTSLTTAAFTLGFRAQAMGQLSDELITGDGASKLGIALNQWISIDTNGLVTLFNHRSEMGQVHSR
jgi:isoquinoline 1-oxidoreductase beta subunit